MNIILPDRSGDVVQLRHASQNAPDDHLISGHLEVKDVCFWTEVQQTDAAWPCCAVFTA